MKKNIYYILFIIGLPFAGYSQSLFYNDGATFYSDYGSIIFVGGSMENAEGKIINNGDVYINGDLINNDSLRGNGDIYLDGNWINDADFIHDTSSVYFTGNNQNVEGSNITYFYNIILQGTGIKHLSINSFVDNKLYLNDLEFATDSFLLTITNTDTSAIQRTSGFVSSLGGGYLVRITNDTLPYLFPLGSSVNSLRYRPVVITPTSNVPSSFAARLVNHDANTDSLYRNNIDTVVCNTLPDFYHKVTRLSGSSEANVSLYYDQSTDGYWDIISNWNDTLWHVLYSCNLFTGSPLSNVTTPIISDFSNENYLLAVTTPDVDLGEDTAICSGSNIVLDAGAGYDSYVWNTGATTQTITIITSGVYSVTVTRNGCTDSDTIKVSEHTIDYTLGGDTIVCGGDTASLFVNTQASYVWFNGDTDSVIYITPSTSGYYSVNIYDSICSIEDSIFVNVVTTSNVMAGDNQVVCVGDSLSLWASGGNSYTWSTGDTTANINVIALDSIIYYVTVSVSGGCEAVDSVIVSAIEPPILNASNDTAICEGETLQLFVSGADSFHWEPSATLSNPNVFNPVAYPTTSTEYIVAGYVGNCSSYDTVDITVYPLPLVNIENDSVAICEGDSINISASGTGNITWNTGDTSWNISVSPNYTTNYIATTTNNYGCEASDTITVNVLPRPIADAGNDLSVCGGGDVQLSASGGSNYHWYPQVGLNNPDIYNPVASVQSTIVYHVMVSNGLCSDEDSVTVFVYPLPYVYAGEDTTIYEGEQVQLNATTNAVSPSFNWIPDNYLTQNNISNPIASPQNTTTFVVIVTDANGCSNSDTITVYVNKKPETQLVIYNTFTPNGDGINDTWYIEGIENYPNNFVVIYNRDGMKVYEKKGYNNEWDGKYYGNDLPAATYYFVLNLGDGSSPIKGYINIVR